MRRLRREDREAGVSLVELLVASVVLAIVLAVVNQLAVRVITITADARSSRVAVGTASTAMNAIAKVLRQAGPVPVSSTVSLPAVTAASATSLSVVSWVDTAAASPVPTAVTFAVNGSGFLVETRAAGTVAGDYFAISATTTSRTVAGPLTLALSYKDASGAAVTSITSTTLPTIRSVVVTVTVANTARRGISDPIVLTQTVVLQNAALQDAVTS